MNDRCINILKYLLTYPPVKTAQLAENFNVSYRTILSDLKIIDLFLHDHFYTPLLRNRKVGVDHNFTEDEIERLLDLLKILQPYDYRMSKKQRETRIILELFKEEKPITLSELSDIVLVSRTTVSDDLENIGIWFQQRNLVLVRKPSLGIYIEGKERFKRKAFMDLLLLDANKDNIAKLVKDHSITLSEMNPEIAPILEELFDAAKVAYIKIIVHNLEERLNIRFTDLSYSTLIIHIGITIDRLKSGNISYAHLEYMDELIKLDEFKIIQDICHDLSQFFKVPLPVPEIVNIMLYVMCTSIQRNVSLSNDQIQPLDVLCNDIILQVELQLGYKFEHYDRLFNDLLLHLGPTVNRVKYDMQLTDSLTEEIRERYPNLFKAVTHACSVIDDFTKKQINDDEIAYIALHFCAAIENQINKSPKSLRVILVCSSGVGTARILESRLKNQFSKLEVVDTLSYQAYLKRNLLDIDLIITTIHIEHTSVPSIHVNPLLTDEDLININLFLENEATMAPDHSLLYMKTLEIIDKHCSVNDRSRLNKDLQELFLLNDDRLEKKVDVAETKHNTLQELLTTATINVQAKYDHWKEAVLETANMLLAQNAILPRYLDALITSCERIGPLGPYCVISPGIAMPHAKPADGVLRTCMSITTLSTPLLFGHTKYDPVKVIIVFGSSDGKNHLKAIEQLTHLLMDSKKVQALKEAKHIEDVLMLFGSQR